jgi:phage baseplate assembly protein W
MTKAFLGKGWSFPVGLEPHRGVRLSAYEKNIEECILVILGTALGERQMRPDFGCGIHDLVFSPNNAHTAGLITYYVEEALTKWEPRIRLISVDVDRTDHLEGRVYVNVEYEVRATNNFFNLVYPFYLQRSEAR